MFGDADFADKEILLLGFTDAVGRPDINQIIASERAEQVRDRLLRQTAGQARVGSINAIGYGPIAPVGCNDEASGREANRRVEVWVR
jgi:phosphate transport system substrate-binding protein